MSKNTYEYTDRKSLTKQTMAGFFWQTSGTVIAALSQFLVMIVLARLLSPSDFGLVSIAYTVTAFTDIMNQFGMVSALIQRKTLTEKHIRSAFTFTILTGVSLTALLWFSAPFLAKFFNDADGLANILRALSFIYITSSLGQVAKALNYRNLNYRIKSIFNVVSYVVGYGFVGMGAAFLGFGAWALVSAALTQSVLLNTLYLFASPHSFKPMLDRHSLAELLGFGAGITLGELFLRLAGNVDYIIVGKTMGLAQVGIYSRAFQLMTYPNRYFGTILHSVLFTSISRVQDEPKTLRMVYRRGVSIISIMTFPLSGFLFVFAPETIRLLYGNNWDAAIIPFQIFVSTLAIRLTVRMGDILIKSSGTVYKRALYQLVYAIMVALGAWIGHFWGIAGVATGVTVASFINFFSMTSLSLQITGLRLSELLRLYLPSLYLSFIVLLESWCLAMLCRFLALPNVVTLLVAAVILGLTVVGLVWRAPKTFVGPDSEWILKICINHLPAPFKRRLSRSPA